MANFPYDSGPIEVADPRIILAAFALLAAIVLVAAGISLWQHHHGDHHRTSHQH